MSAFGKQGVRCDWCGRFSNNLQGEYMKPDGVSAGYIRMERDGDGIDRGADLCEECRDGQCVKCGSVQLVRVTPANPGPDGWGWRCKSCGHRWDLLVPAE